MTHLDLLRLKKYANIAIEPKTISLYEASLYEDLSFPRVIFAGREYFLALNSKDDGSCIFLSRNGRCSVHPFKPLVCRFYPFVYFEKNGDIDIDVNENAIGECPGLVDDGKPIPENIRSELIALAKARITELKMWGEVAKKWNETSFSKEEFSKVAKTFIEFILSYAEEDMKKLIDMKMWIP